ncbi:hypothetical protein PILCRDRAFT_822468 [Piloderma croceum F 1598]|uniref:Uncharacterized protein n=1 Tax=Piloderma croceum (strain F 1598) TaxID=765440 RepID=A0A0C3FLG4_PILCF|nr:hypothetical protein PILCRDRAFT_822468 [Piloderma croceum F 1598]
MSPNNRLTEEIVQDSFHSYLKSSLAQAKAEKLLDADILSSAEGDLMITGPALCLYFGALRCTTDPPSVPLPRQTKTSSPLDLSQENCPEAFISFLNVWASCVPRIQSLAPEHQHDLARIICNLEPLTRNSDMSLGGIAADLRAVAIDISQRRTFQERYGGDLQAAIDAGSGGSAGVKITASFVPPPVYDPSPNSSPGASPRNQASNLPASLRPGLPGQIISHNLPPQSPSHLSPNPAPRTPSPSRSTPSPTFLTQDTPAIEAIRETLYASLADVLERSPSLRGLLKRDPPRAYFASVAFAILEVATTSITPEGSIVGVLGRELTVAQCPPGLRPMMLELGAIGRMAKEVEEEDTEEAMKLAQAGKDIPPPRMERMKLMLEEGVGHDAMQESSGRRSVEGRAVAFANRVNALALGMTRLKAFRERQKDVFKVLAGIGP